MKSVIKENKTEQVDRYPKLMRYENWDGDFVVFFTEQRKGVIVYAKNCIWEIGYESNSWSEAAFTPFSGTIELSNN